MNPIVSRANFGSLIDYVIVRANGTVEKPHGSVHNVLSQAWISDGNRWANSGTWTVRTHNTKVRSTLTGTFSQSGTTITRQSGSSALNAETYLFVWPDGSKSFGVSSAATTATVNVSATKSAQALDAIAYARAIGSDQQGIQTYSSAVAPTYSNGVLETLETAPITLPPATVSYALNRISVSRTVPGSTYPLWYDLPSPVTINIGDVVVITSIRLTFTWDSHAPRILAVSPITGITSSCKYQRTLDVSVDPSISNLDRVWLITTPNKVTLPNQSLTSLTTSGLTIAQTLTPRATGDASTVTRIPTATSNGFSGTQDFFVTTPTSQSDVKQIAWGRNTGNVICGILEFDTPQTIAANKVIRIREELAINIEL